MKYKLVVKDLQKNFNVSKGNIQQVLNHVSFHVEDGEFVSVMGPSGSGKSTLLYNVSGMDRMSGGSVSFQDQDIAALSEKELAQVRLLNMGFIFQQPHLLKNLSLFDNIVYPAYMAGAEERKIINQRAGELMKKTGVAELADKDITQASGGQLQRVGICRALINKPAMIFGDEPTGALNSKSADEVMDILTEINLTGTTIMLVTHDARVAARTERVLFMKDGVFVGEKVLGKYSGGLKERNEGLSRWLSEMGF